jgi:hypothetical protein
LLDGADFGVGGSAWADGGTSGGDDHALELGGHVGEGWLGLAVYQGDCSRRSAASAGWWPCSACQMTVIV